MNLKVILKLENQIKIKEVSVLGENENFYFIKCDGIDYTSIDKKSLYKSINGVIFGFDKKKLICVWNDLKKEEICLLENKLYTLKKSILSKDTNENDFEL